MLQTERRAARKEAGGSPLRRALRRRPAVLAAAGMLAGVLALTGCAWGGDEDPSVEIMDEATAEAVTDELSDAVAAQLESAELEQFGIFTGGPLSNVGDGSPAVVETEVGSAARPVTLLGACAGAEGFATVGVIGGGTAVLQCTVEGESYDVQTLIERFVPGATTVTTEVNGMPVGAVWSIAVAGVAH